MSLKQNASWIKPVAKIGLAAKGTVYCLVGLLAFMSAFGIGGQTSEKTDKEDVFKLIMEQPAGRVILAIVALGLLAYAVWRFVQTFLDTEDKGSKIKGIANRLSYFASGLTYLLLSILSVKLLLSKNSGGGDSQKEMVQNILDQPAGQWLLGIVAAIMAGVGIYQLWYGHSEKYKKHVDLQGLNSDASSSLIRAGKIGYIARGIVWLIVAFLFLKAALHQKASEAGDTSSAFAFVEKSSFGNYLLALLALGLICYGVLNFVRAAFEKFKF